MQRKNIFFAAVVFFGGFVTASLFLFLQPGVSAADNGRSPDEPQSPIGTSFSYQGYLDNGGSAANGLYDFRFRLFDNSTGGTQIGSTLNMNAVNVMNGLFIVSLDFGQSAFGGGARWLQIGVRPAGDPPYTTLSPRQEIYPAPSALSLPNVYTNESSNFVGIGRDFRISSNEVFGIRYIGGANEFGGMYVETSDANGWPFYGYATNGTYHAWTFYNGSNGDWLLYNDGIRLRVPNEGGLFIGPGSGHSLVISDTTGIDGIHIYETGDDGIQVGESPSQFPNYGLYIPPNPGVDYYGLWPNTANGSGQWALYTVDNIEAGNVVANAYSLIAMVTGPEPLAVGDVVAVTSVTDPIPGSTVPVPLVRGADESSFTGVIGVVDSRMVWDTAPGKEAEGAMSMQSATGSARPGDYVSLVVYGITDIRIDPGANIAAGDRLTAAAEAGRARALQTRTVDGMIISEGAQVIGIALAAPTEAADTVPAFVTLR